MPIIDEILENKKLQKDAVYSGKDSFDNLTNSKVDELAKHLIDAISEKIQINKITGYKNAGEYSKNKELFKHPKRVKNHEEKTKCTILPENKINRFEDILERMIKISSDNCNNQVAIPDLSHIDLAIKDEDNKTINIIELKKWNNEKNNPCYTIAENIKNLYMLLHLAYHYNPENKYKYCKNILSGNFGDSDDSGDKKFYKIENVKKFILTILAPEKYFELHFSNDKLKENYKKFCLELEKCIQEDLRRKLNKEDLEIKIEIKQIGLTLDEFEIIINKLQDKTEENIKKRAGKFEKDKKGHIIINLEDYISVFCNKKYKEKLTKWEDVIK